MKPRVELNLHENFNVCYEVGEFWLYSKRCTGCSLIFSMRFFHRFSFKTNLGYEFVSKKKKSGFFVLCASCFFDCINDLLIFNKQSHFSFGKNIINSSNGKPFCFNIQYILKLKLI